MANLTTLEVTRLNGITSATQEVGLGTHLLQAQTDIDTAEGNITTNTSNIATINGYRTDVATDVGLLHHVKIDIATGAAGDTDKALPTGTWDVVDCYVIMRSAGETSDTVRLYKKPAGSAVAISDAMSAAGADNAVVRAASIDDDNAEGLIGGTDALRVTTTDNDAGGDVAAMEVHVVLRKVA